MRRSSADGPTCTLSDSAPRAQPQPVGDPLRRHVLSSPPTLSNRGFQLKGKGRSSMTPNTYSNCELELKHCRRPRRASPADGDKADVSTPFSSMKW